MGHFGEVGDFVAPTGGKAWRKDGKFEPRTAEFCANQGIRGENGEVTENHFRIQPDQVHATPFGVGSTSTAIQGRRSYVAPTLRWFRQSRWDCRGGRKSFGGCSMTDGRLSIGMIRRRVSHEPAKGVTRPIRPGGRRRN